MKKTIISCTITLCGVVCAVGYFVACSCGNGAMSSPLYYLETRDFLTISILMTIALIGLIVAIKDMQKLNK